MAINYTIDIIQEMAVWGNTISGDKINILRQVAAWLYLCALEVNYTGQDHGKQKWKWKWGECTTGTYEIYDKRDGYHRPFCQYCGHDVPVMRKLAMRSLAGDRPHCGAADDALGSTRYSTACYPSDCSWGGALLAQWWLLEKMGGGWRACHLWWCAGLVTLVHWCVI